MNAEIVALDRALARTGETITLRRGTTTAPTALATVKAHVRGYKPEELIGGITQTDSLVTLSPTDLVAANWPMPPKKGDWAIIQGRARSVEVVGLIVAADVLVRIEMRVLG